MNFPSFFLITHLCSLIFLSLSPSLSYTHKCALTHTHTYTLSCQCYIIPQALSQEGEKWFKQEENLSSILLRDLTMLTTMTSYLFHLHRPLHFIMLLSLFNCTLPYLLEPVKQTRGRAFVLFTVVLMFSK